MPEITIPARNGGSFMAYMALPAKMPAPAIIVVQEIFGVNQGLRDKCDELARQGFIAVCPDLFWRMEPGVQLTDQTEAEWQKAFGFYQKFDVDKGIDDLRSTAHVVRGHADSTGKVGCVGYCLGGKLAYLMACRSNVDASVGYYGVEIDKLLAEAKNIKKPLMLHIAEADKFVTPAAQKQVKDGLKDNPLVTIHSYPGMDHAFTRVGGQGYNDAAAQQADARTLAFFKAHLNLAMAA